jgi:hypothetical protein
LIGNIDSICFTFTTILRGASPTGIESIDLLLELSITETVLVFSFRTTDVGFPSKSIIFTLGSEISWG